MNALMRGSLYMLAVAVLLIGLGLLDAATGIVSAIAPTEAHAFGWLAIIIVCVMIARSFVANGVGLPSLRSVAMPRMKTRYAKRVRKFI